MLKLISIVFIGLLIAGCSTHNKKSIAHKPFQMVAEKDAVLVQEGKNKKYCSICGMDLVRFYKTSHISENYEEKYQYCSIHCLEDHLGHGVTVKNPMVVDVKSLKFIPVGKAHYVVGSKKRGTMSYVSKYAFLKLDDAKKFQVEFGGEIMDFTDAREKAQEDFKHYKH